MRDRGDVTGMYPEAMTIRFDIPLSQDDSRLSLVLHGEVPNEMSPVPCKGARAGNAVQNAESIGHVERAPQAMQRRLWAPDSIPVALEQKGIRGW